MSENLENSVIVSKIPQTKDYNEQASELVKDSQTRKWFTLILIYTVYILCTEDVITSPLN